MKGGGILFFSLCKFSFEVDGKEAAKKCETIMKKLNDDDT